MAATSTGDGAERDGRPGAGQDAGDDEQHEVRAELRHLRDADAGPGDRRGQAGGLQVAGVERDVADRGRGDEPAEGHGELRHVGAHEAEVDLHGAGERDGGAGEGRDREGDGQTAQRQSAVLMTWPMSTWASWVSSR